VILSDGEVVDTGVGMGELTPSRYGSELFVAGGAGLHLSGSFASYAQLYKSQPWVKTLVSKLGTGTSRLPIGTYQRTDKGRQDASHTPYGELMRRPNPRLGRVLLWLWVSCTYDLYGESMLLKLRDDSGRVRELWPMHPANVLVKVINGEVFYGYMGRGYDLRAVWPASEVVHFRAYNPDTLLRGLSPCEPLRQTLLAEDAMRRTSAAMWRNGARAGVVLSHPKTLSKPAAEKLKAAWDAMHAGVDNAGKTAVLEEGLTPHLLQQTAEDMQYIDGRRLNREECCAVWDVPPPAVHILDRATFSNVTENLRSLYRDTHAARLPIFEDTLRNQLAPDFTALDEIYMTFLLDEILRGDAEKAIPANAQAIGTAQATPNEVRRQGNLPDVEGGDELYINAALIPLSMATTGRTLPSAVPAAQNAAKGLSERDARTVAGRLSRVEDVDAIDADLLVDGLTSDTPVVRGLVRAAQLRGTPVATLRKQITASAATPLDGTELDPAELDGLLEQTTDSEELT
jgi:HK97 family phage portal protein